MISSNLCHQMSYLLFYLIWAFYPTLSSFPFSFKFNLVVSNSSVSFWSQVLNLIMVLCRGSLTLVLFIGPASFSLTRSKNASSRVVCLTCTKPSWMPAGNSFLRRLFPNWLTSSPWISSHISSSHPRWMCYFFCTRHVISWFIPVSTLKLLSGGLRTTVLFSLRFYFLSNFISLKLHCT